MQVYAIHLQRVHLILLIKLITIQRNGGIQKKHKMPEKNIVIGLQELLVTEKKGMDAWKVSFECQIRSDGYENTHRKATGSTKYEPKTAPERAQGHLEQQEASK